MLNIKFSLPKIFLERYRRNKCQALHVGPWSVGRDWVDREQRGRETSQLICIISGFFQ